MLPSPGPIPAIDRNIDLCVSSLVRSSWNGDSLCTALIDALTQILCDIDIKFHCVGSSAKHTQVCTSALDFDYVVVHLRENHNNILPYQLLENLHQRITAALPQLRQKLAQAIMQVRRGNKTLQITYNDRNTRFTIDLVPAVMKPGVVSSEGCYVPRTAIEWGYQWKGLEPFLLERYEAANAVALAKVVKDSYFPKEKIKSCAIEFLLARMLDSSNQIEELRPQLPLAGYSNICTFVTLYRILLCLKFAVTKEGNITILQLHDHESDVLADMSEENRQCVDRVLTGVLILLQEFISECPTSNCSLFWVLTNQHQYNSWNGSEWQGIRVARLHNLLKPKLYWSIQDQTLGFGV